MRRLSALLTQSSLGNCALSFPWAPNTVTIRAVAFPKHFEPGHIAAALALGTLALVLIAVVGREIYFAANPDKRPRKRKRRR